MKTILLINSSARKKNTYKVLKNIANILEKKGYNTEEINLKDYDIKSCSGCEVCIYKDSCTLKDDCEDLLCKLQNCDGIVIGTPVYLNNMSGRLKTFIDRTCKWFHRPTLIGKPVVLVATTAGSGIKNTFNSIEESLVQWGVDIVSKVGRKLTNLNEPVTEEHIKDFLMYLETNGQSYKPSFKQIITYQLQKVLAINVLEFDKKYWQEKGWLNKYYYDTRNVNVLKKFIGNIIFKILVTKIKPVNND